jgi:hypothetical protein
VEDDGLDLVDALHQQEIAAEYYARRGSVMNKNVLTEVLESTATDEKQNSWDKEVRLVSVTKAI